MPFSFISVGKLLTLGFIFQVLFVFLLITTFKAQAANEEKITNIGAIIDVNSRIGKEQKVAMEIAARNFNNSSKKQKLSLHFQDSRRETLIAASTGYYLSPFSLTVSL